jgi:hypothetical protein
MRAMTSEVIEIGSEHRHLRTTKEDCMDNSSKFLRNVLLADGLISGITGVALAALPETIGSLIGAGSAVVAMVGAGLIAFGVALLHNGRRERAARFTAQVAVALNLVWVAGSGLVLLAGWLTPLGRWGVVFVGDAVLVFTAFELIALRRTAHRVDRAFGASNA